MYGLIGMLDALAYASLEKIARDLVGSSRGVNQALGYLSTVCIIPIMLGSYKTF